MKIDVAVVGGGIVGLANAWMAARKGYSVALFERDHVAAGASVRNFGMIWPIGQPAGELFELALRSRAFWLELKLKAGVWVNQCGSFHLARHEDERAVLQEFIDGDCQSEKVKLFTADEVLAKSNGANPDGLLCGMWSPFELCVNPPAAIAQMSNWLASQDKISIHTGTAITQIDGNRLLTGDGKTIESERIAVCSGSDFETLFPDQFREAGLKKCKLQMMATATQPDNWTLGPHLAGGLTLRHYRSFETCPSLQTLRQRIAVEKPLLDRYGIHVMASQNDVGQVILGDSHVYDQEITPFDSNEIEQLMLDELRNLICIPDFKLASRWHGIYAKHPDQHVMIKQPQPNCKIITATGGAGMTLAFGLAEQVWNDWN